MNYQSDEQPLLFIERNLTIDFAKLIFRGKQVYTAIDDESKQTFAVKVLKIDHIEEAQNLIQIKQRYYHENIL